MGERNTGDRFEMLANSEFVEITNGLPFANAQELHTYMITSFEKSGVSRFPILGIKDDQGNIKSYLLLSDKEHGKSTHASLNGKLGDPIGQGKLVYATSLDGFMDERPSVGLLLKDVSLPNKPDLKEDAFIPMTKQSDFRVSGSNFNPDGQAEIKRIFFVPGIEFVGF